MKFNLLTLLISFLTLNLIAQQAPKRVLVTDLVKIKQLSAVSLFNEGSRVLFTANSIVPVNDKTRSYVYETQVYTANTKGAPNVRALTSGKAGAAQPALSPDDQTLAFVRNIEGHPQIFLLSMAGGEAVQLTDSKYGATQPRWSPDGKNILFASPITLTALSQDSMINTNLRERQWASEKPGYKISADTSKAKPNADGNMREIRSFLSKQETDGKAKVFNNLDFQGEASTSSELTFTHYFLTEAKSGSKPRALTKGYYSYSQAGFTPDGKAIILTADIDSLEHPDRHNQGDILSLDIASRKLTTIASKKGFNFSSPKLSPSGRWLACLQAPENGINVAKLLLIDLGQPGAEPRIIPFDRAPANLTWSPDEQYLYFTAASNGGSPLHRLDVKRNKILRLGSFDSGVESFDLSKNQLVYVKTEVANPYELYSSDLLNKLPRALTALNQEWIKGKEISLPEKKYFTNEKGLKVEYWVMKPINFDPAKKYPLVIQMHGGPAAMWGPGEASMWHEFQYFCSQGFGVVYANPRGSGGYGQEFLRANYQDWGKGPASDVLKSMEGVIDEGWVDTSKLTITGGSYAGYLTAWIIAHDKRFAAASSQRGVYELSTFFGEGNAWRLVPNYFGGYPWEAKTEAILKRESPFTYVAQINTPYLIFHGESDLRTGVIQSEMMYKALKVQRKEVEYVRHPGATHELTRSGNVQQRIDQMLRIYEFFKRYVN